MDADAMAAACRVVHLAALAGMFGTLLFRCLIAPAPDRLLRGFWAVSVIAALGWLGAQAALFAGADDIRTWLAALAAAAGQTRFGRILLLRLALLAPVPWLARRRRDRPALALAAVGLALQPMLAHAGASGETWPVLAGSLHMLAVGAWVGALPALFLALRAATAPEAARLARRFSALGLTAVLVMTAGGIGLAWALLGGWPALVGTHYGRLLLLKLLLLAAMLALATWNRFGLTPRLGQDAAARRRIQRSILAETALGGACICVAGWMAGAIPGAHLQADWPFPVHPSLAALAEPELRAELARALTGLGLAVLAATLAAGFRRQLAALLLVLAGLAWAGPSAGLMFVPAWPTSYWQAPEPTAEARALGQTLYQRDCAACHGADGRGDGPAARGLDIPPADLTAAHLWEHLDGELYWWIGHGIAAPSDGFAMPAHPDLTEDELWALIAHIRAANPYAALARPGAGRHVHR